MFLSIVQCFDIKPYTGLFLVLVLKKGGPRLHRAAHLHRLVPATLHVSGQIRRWGYQPAPGRLSHNHPGRVPGNHASLRVSNPPPFCGSLPSAALSLTTG